MPTLRRIGALVRLLLILGLPVAVVVGIFGWGLAFGAAHRASVLHWEQRLLGWKAPPQHDEAPAEDEASAEPSTASPTPTREEAGGRVQDERPVPAGEPEAPAATAPTPERDGPRTPPTPAQNEAARMPPRAAPTPSTAAVEAPPTPRADPAGRTPAAEDLDARLSLPVTIRVKVLVDDTVRADHPDWIDYVQRLLAAGSSVYAEQFGIRFDLVGLARWPVPTAGIGARALYEDLAGRPREGADIVLGLTDRPLADGDLAGLGGTPAEDAPFNASVALVYARPRIDPKLPHLPVLLHEVAHLFGARDVTDRTTDAYRSGSWMAPLDARRTGRPWIDPGNRRTILLRKDRPFAPEGQEAHRP